VAERKRTRLRVPLAAALAAAAVALGPGCRTAATPERGANTIAGIDINSPDLIRDLSLFRRNLTATAQAIWRGVIDAAPDGPERSALDLGRRRTLNAIANAYDAPNAFASLLETWWLIERYRFWLVRNGEDPSISPSETPTAAADSRHPFRSDAFAGEQIEILHRQIVGIARRHIPSERFAAVEREIEESARGDAIRFSELTADRPAQGGVSAGLFDTAAGSQVVGVLGLPLAPFIAAQNVGDAARSTEAQLQRLVDIIERYPDRFREIIDGETDDFYASRLARNAETALQEAGDASRRIADAADRLPADLDRAIATARREADALLDEMATRSAEFEALLESYRASADETVRVVESARTALGEAGPLVESATAAATAWTATAAETRTAIDAIAALTASDGPPVPPGEEDFTFKRLEAIAVEARAALVELRGALADARSLADDPATAALEARTAALVDRAGRWGVTIVLLAGLVGAGLILLFRGTRRG